MHNKVERKKEKNDWYEKTSEIILKNIRIFINGMYDVISKPTNSRAWMGKLPD